jgi:hypothetical protein
MSVMVTSLRPTLSLVITINTGRSYTIAGLGDVTVTVNGIYVTIVNRMASSVLVLHV